MKKMTCFKMDISNNNIYSCRNSQRNNSGKIAKDIKNS